MTTSRRARATEVLLRRLVRPVLSGGVPLSVQRPFLTGLQGGLPLPRGTQVWRSTLGGRPTLVVAAAGASGPPVLLAHGGAFVTCSPRTHRAFAAHLSAASAAPVHVQDHRLAPEHPFPAALDDTVAALRALGPGARVVGDSAGGWLALSAVLALRDAGDPLPPRVGLVSPVVDLTLASSRAWTGPDPLLSLSWMELGVGAFLGGEDALARSPLQADLSGLPPLLVQVSEHERLRPEGEELVRRVQASGGDATLELLQGVWHDVHVQAGVLPEATAAVRSLGAWLAAG
ncbi:MAG: hypothetical protein JWO60_3211 [Frankiales bacterium]|nr:hypothetical protein [Frankiales bacterium]